MEFFATNGKRPIRLSEQTRQFAFDSLQRRYGKETRATDAVAVDDYPAFESLSYLEKYDVAITYIAERAPIRICDGEKISGAATLGRAIDHGVPATYQGEGFVASVSHLTLNFEKVLRHGVNAIEQEVDASLDRYRGTEKEPFLRSCKRCLSAFRTWHTRYLDALRDRPAYAANYHNLQRVPFSAATTFYEAIQSLWFTFAFTRLCGNWPGIGRIDWLLGDYLERDLKQGTVTIDQAREILAHFFIKGCEWVYGDGLGGSGDAQHYQNILLGGIDQNGNEITNAVTYLVLDVLEELGIGDFPTTVRLNKHTPERLLTRVADVIRLGGGTVAVYNEDLILEALTAYGYPKNEVWRFANDGCWEVQIPGRTRFGYTPFDGLTILQRDTLKQYDGTSLYDSFESLYAAFIRDLYAEIVRIKQAYNTHFVSTDGPTTNRQWKPNTPCTVVSLFEDGCIEKGLSYYEGGPVYNVLSPHIGGLPDVVNSLYAIKKLVFDDRKVSFLELMTILKNDWDENEPLRQFALNKYLYFGNDNDEVDAIAVRILGDFAAMCDSDAIPCGYRTPAGVSTFGRQLGWSKTRLATPYGKRAGEVLAANFSPTPGTDREGATAIIRSYCKADLKRTVCGAALDIKLLPSAVGGENGREALVSLLRGFVAEGGFFMQPDIADASLLRQAQEHPEDYGHLSVRVSGWNARFVTLNKEWQDMIIAQTGCDF